MRRESAHLHEIKANMVQLALHRRDMVIDIESDSESEMRVFPLANQKVELHSEN